MYFVYFLTNKTNTVLYIGVTNDLKRRLYEHPNGLMEGFTKRYRLTKIVYYEAYQDVALAIAREKQLKRWTRAKKEALIRQQNPAFDDLTNVVFA